MSFITDRLQDKKIGTEYDLLKETCQIHQRIWLVVVILKKKQPKKLKGALAVMVKLKPATI